MSRKGPKPYLHGHQHENGVTLTLFESVQGALRAIARWEEPDIGSIQESGELVRRLESVREQRKSQEKWTDGNS